MDRLSSRDGGQGDMMPPPFANLNPVMANYVNSNDVPVGDMLQRQLFGIITPSLPHQRHIGGPASEYGATPDSAYGTNSVRGKPSTGKRSLYNGSNASTMSTVARLEGGVNGIQLDTRSEASLPRSEYLMPLTGAPAAEKWVSSMMPAYGQKMTTDDPWESAYSALDTTDVFSTPDINNDSQSVNGGAELVELHCIKNQNGFNCTICPKQQGKVTKTRSEML
ncbi:hypothetical protein Sste5346_002659 [Sporothrix stenoceras]|uniref:Uncharacterized protein n=1 Tax=Sporothrix stenoceras TaxID=5173 RepID=A0ABR3ZGE4_9PEZI